MYDAEPRRLQGFRLAFVSAPALANARPGIHADVARKRNHRESFKELVAVWVDLFRAHNLLTYASAIAFQTLVALVAILLLTFGIVGAIGRPDVWSMQIAPHVEPKVLKPVFEGMDATARKIFHSSSGGLIAFAAVLTIWEISGVIRACMGALAQIYEHEENRPWWRRFGISLAIAVVVTGAIVGAILLATAARTAVHGGWGIPFAVARWLLAVALIAFAFGLLVRFAPVDPRTTRWASGGATLVVVAWVVQSLLFGVYLRYASYTTAVGSLLLVYVVTTYLYVAAIVLLVGIELDELLRRDLRGEEERGILEIVRDVL
jgi:membrane protein